MTILVIWLKSDKVVDTVREDLRRFMIYRRDWATILSEAEETVDHQAWPMICVECRRLRFIDFRSSHLQNLDDGRLYICC